MSHISHCNTIEICSCIARTEQSSLYYNHVHSKGLNSCLILLTCDYIYDHVYLNQIKNMSGREEKAEKNIKGLFYGM